MAVAVGSVPRTALSSLSLRARLLATLVALVVGVTIAVGAVSVVELRGYLNGRLDSDVTRAAVRTSRALAATTKSTSYFGPGQPPGTVIGVIRGGKVTAATVLTQGGDLQQLSGPAAPWLAVPVDRHAHTVDLGSGVGRYRMVAIRATDGSIAVTGLPTDTVDDTVGRLSAVVVVVALAALLLAVLVGAAIIRLALRPLRRVAATAREVSELPLDRGEVALAVRVPDADSRTEVGQVGAALNNMLGHVANALTARQESETRTRQFVADASHELRTPLAAIRGYTELVRRNPEPVPPDVAHAIGRVESQAVRMTGLVEDLLLLARLDCGRAIEHEPVDLAGLLVGAVSDAHAAGPDHIWRLELREEPEVAVLGDSAGLTQVMLNLLANSRTHTPPGTTVVANLRRTATHAELSVTDDGPGIPEALQPEVFERFTRGDASRSRGAGSTGLGLSIVAAIVSAHSGTVELASRPGATVFTVRLPLAPAPASV